jgi:hypothetical protein
VSGILPILLVMLCMAVMLDYLTLTTLLGEHIVDMYLSLYYTSFIPHEQSANISSEEKMAK